MAAMSDFLENALIDHIFRTTNFTAPTALWVALFTAAPSDSGGGTEVSGGNYARINLAPADANWEGTHGSNSGNSSGTGGATQNSSIITFGVPSANWGTISHFGIFSAVTAGDLYFHGALTASKTVNNGDPAPTFPVDSLDITLD